MLLFLIYLRANFSNKIGINYGQLGNNLPSPSKSIELIKSMKAGGVKLYDANPEILKLLSGTKIQVSIMVANNEISSIASSQRKAEEWIKTNVLPYYPKTKIRFLLVGNEILSYNSDQDRQNWRDLVPAMSNIRSSLKSRNITDVKVGTPLAMDVVESTFPPSSGKFRSDVSGSVILPMLRFLNKTKSFFFIDVYPYFPWSQNPSKISLDSALLKGNFRYKDPGTGLVYTNLLDQMLDSIIFAMTKLGFPKIPLLIAETGWPTSGDGNLGANVVNAAIYNRNLVKRMTAKQPLGTPVRPGVVIPTFIFSLFEENQKTGAAIERHWGLLGADGTPLYDIDLTGNLPAAKYKPLQLSSTENDGQKKGKAWCVVARGANLMAIRAALSYACGVGNGTCDALKPGHDCHAPATVAWRASYAFSSYWAKFKSQGATCYFNGLAQQTTTDPSKYFFAQVK
ncbi:hypothetical protein UlMin_010478 [Ulmus minor]